MRRKILLFLLMAIVAASTATGVRASSDCERWIATYKMELAHSRAVRRMQVAQARMKMYARRKLANYTRKPAAPKAAHPHVIRPKYTRREIMDRFNLMCGHLPVTSRVLDQRLVGKAPMDLLAEAKPSVLEELIPAEGTGFLASETVAPFVPGDADVPQAPTFAGVGGPPIFGGGGGGGIVGGVGGPGLPGGPGAPGGPGSGGPIVPGSGGPGAPGSGGPGTPGSGGPSIPGGPGGPGAPGGTGDTGGSDLPVVPEIPPVTTPVPEPGSLVLLLTGIAGAAATIRRRIAA